MFMIVPRLSRGMDYIFIRNNFDFVNKLVINGVGV